LFPLRYWGSRPTTTDASAAPRREAPERLGDARERRAGGSAHARARQLHMSQVEVRKRSPKDGLTNEQRADAPARKTPWERAQTFIDGLDPQQRTDYGLRLLGAVVLLCLVPGATQFVATLVLGGLSFAVAGAFYHTSWSLCCAMIVANVPTCLPHAYRYLVAGIFVLLSTAEQDTEIIDAIEAKGVQFLHRFTNIDLHACIVSIRELVWACELGQLETALTTVADNIVHHPSVKALDAACVEGCDALAAVDPTFPRDQIPKDAMTRACAQFAHDLKQNAPELEKQIEQHARAAEEGIKKGEQKVKDGIKATLNRAQEPLMIYTALAGGLFLSGVMVGAALGVRDALVVVILGVGAAKLFEDSGIVKRYWFKLIQFDPVEAKRKEAEVEKKSTEARQRVHDAARSEIRSQRAATKNNPVRLSYMGNY
jgi:hypothetical protein